MRGGVELRFTASLQGLELGEGRLATFYLMDTGLNRNNWRVTWEALVGALETLPGKPLGCIPGYRVNHVHRPQVVGRWLGAEEKDGHAIATAEITDDGAWERLGAGEWGPVSVVIRASRVTCGFCGGDITGGPDIHVQRGEAEEVVERFAFVRVDFVSEPAYPAAGVVRLDSHLRAGGLHRLDSQSNTDGAQGPRGVDPKPEGKREKKRLERKIAQLEHELETTRAENEGLKAERLKGLLERVMEARSRAGLSRNPGAEAERLRGLGEEALAFIAEDAERANANTGHGHTGPKATYVAGRGGLREAVEETRMRLFGHRRDP
jgi:hypothetical protein